MDQPRSSIRSREINKYDENRIDLDFSDFGFIFIYILIFNIESEILRQHLSFMCGSCHIQSVLNIEIGIELWMFIYLLLFCVGNFIKN